MSRYVLLVLLNMPFIVAGLLNALVSYKLRKSTRRRFLFQTILWLLVFIGLILSKPAYEYLFSNKLTDTEPLSLFDVIQITGIIFTLFVVNRLRIKQETLEHRLQDLHQELSIKLAEDSDQKIGK